MTVDTARPLPTSPEAEAAILGGFMRETPGIEDAFALEAEDFFDARNRIIFLALRGLHGDGKATNDLNVLTDALRSSGKLDEVGIEYVAAIGDDTPKIQPIDQHIHTVRRTKFLRRVIHLGERAHQPHGERIFPELVQLAAALSTSSNCTTLDWRKVFHSIEDFESSPGLVFAIEGFLQTGAATMIAALPGQSKTFVLLSIIRSLLTARKLWDLFDVTAPADRVLYLIPESSIGPFKHRLELFGLMDFVRNDRLLVRTLSMGPTPLLTDPRILVAAKNADVFLDTATRFNTNGDENSASGNLAADIFALLGSGARLVAIAHHAPKSFATQITMTLENVARGSGDLTAMLATCWGLRQLDEYSNIVYVQNVKPRDFEPCRPFQLVGRPFINTEGNFRIHKQPGQSGFLQDELDLGRDRGGAAWEQREERQRRIETVRDWLTDNPALTRNDIVNRFAKTGINVGHEAVKKYISDARCDRGQA